MKENFIETYYKKINNGEILACKKIHLMYDKVIAILNDENSRWCFKENKANKVIDFIETFCCHVKGKMRGKPLKLELWQKAMISVVFGIVDKETGFRKYKQWHLYIARKNGKTLLAACILLYLMIADGEKASEVYTASTKQDQAKLAWDMAKQIILNSPILYSRFKLTVFGIFAGEHRECLFKALSKDSKSLDGLNASAYLIDELHAITDDNIIDVLWDSTVAREQPLEIITTTMGTTRASTFDNKYEYDEKFLYGLHPTEDVGLAVFCYELDEESEYKNIKNVIKANPNLEVSLSTESIIEELKKVENDSSKKSDILCKRFNVRMTNSQSWLSFETFNNENIIDLLLVKDKSAIGGFDLSQTGDLTAFTTMYFYKGSLVCETMYWCTADFLKKHEKAKVNFYKWVEAGLLRISGTNKIDYHDVANYVLEQFDKGVMYQFICYDSYSASYLIDEISNLGFAKEKCLRPVIQGFKTLSIPMQTLEGFLKDKKVIYQNNPITKWCFSNAILVKDRNGNWMLDKSNYEMKIDGVSTILNCMVSLCENLDYFLNLNKT